MSHKENVKKEIKSQDILKSNRYYFFLSMHNMYVLLIINLDILQSSASLR